MAGWRGTRAVVIACGAALAGGRAAADRAAADAAHADWATGWIVAGGTGLADRHAPSPAVALGTSRRGAEDAARRRISALVPSLPLAGGGTLADRLADPASKARIDAAVDAAITLAAEPETDGSWHVTLAVPIEAIRLAIDAPRTVAAAGDRGPPSVIVDGVVAQPAIGWRIGGTPAATLWVKRVPEWARAAPHVHARAATAGSISVDAAGGAAATAATLYLIVAAS